jgi:hypothetical protein
VIASGIEPGTSGSAAIHCDLGHRGSPSLDKDLVKAQREETDEREEQLLEILVKGIYETSEIG